MKQKTIRSGLVVPWLTSRNGEIRTVLLPTTMHARKVRTPLDLLHNGADQAAVKSQQHKHHSKRILLSYVFSQHLSIT